MKTEGNLKLALTTLAILTCGVTSRAQQNDQASGSVTSSVRMIAGPDGNGTMSVITNGQQQDFLVTPDGTVSIGPDGQPQAAANGGAQPFVQKFAAAPKVRQFVAPGGGGVFKNGGGAGLVDINQIRQQVMNALKDTLGCTDEEWAVLGPKIERVQLLQNAIGEKAKAAMIMQNSNDDPTIPESVKTARARLTEFDKAVKNPQATDAQVRQALAAIREARGKVRGELAQAHKDLTDLVTPRQEAILYQFGILEQ
jgi:hypothetical protein